MKHHTRKRRMPREDSMTHKILEHIRANPGTTGSQIRTALSQEVKADSIGILLTGLRRRNLIENRGSNSSGQWYPAGKIASPEYFEIASDLLMELAGFHSTYQPEYLANRLEEIFEETKE